MDHGNFRKNSCPLCYRMRSTTNQFPFTGTVATYETGSTLRTTAAPSYWRLRRVGQGRFTTLGRAMNVEISMSLNRYLTQLANRAHSFVSSRIDRGTIGATPSIHL